MKPVLLSLIPDLNSNVAFLQGLVEDWLSYVDLDSLLVFVSKVINLELSAKDVVLTLS
jgi:hypothetical protein